MAKPLANGYPLGAVLMRDAVAETMTAGTTVLRSCERVMMNYKRQAHMERHLEVRRLLVRSDTMSWTG
jgi:4-aminobutyrate aminotransferase-like enzyme